MASPSMCMFNKSSKAAAVNTHTSKEIENFFVQKCTNELTSSFLSRSSLSSSASRLAVDGFNYVKSSMRKYEPQPEPEMHLGPTTMISGQQSSCTFIDASDLVKKLCEMSKKIILLDCRTYNDYNQGTIQDAVHINCRDKLIKKRLQNQKITVRDLISCELTKNKLNFLNTNGSARPAVDTVDATSKLAACLTKRDISSCNLNQQRTSITNAPSSFQSLSSQTPKLVQALSSTSSTECEEKETSAPEKEGEKDNNIIVIYDETTSDVNDLMVESNPLKIVQENIKKAGFNKECKILKGGFKQFAQYFPQMCKSKKSEVRSNQVNSHYYDEQDQNQSVLENANMTEITPYLYLGNEVDAKNTQRLAQMGIHYVLNVTKNIPFYENPTSCKQQQQQQQQFTFKRIPVNDCINQNLREYFDEAIDFIDQARANNSKVLVHCQAGVSRSPTIVIAYLMRKFNMSMNEAYNRVREIRPIIAPNLIFMSQLMDFESLVSQHVNKNTQSDQNTCSSSISTSSSSSSSSTNNIRMVDAYENATPSNSQPTKAPIECN